MELHKWNIYISSSESSSDAARKTLLLFLVAIINSHFGLAEGNSRQPEFCRQKWDTCMDIPTHGKYPSAADCDEVVFDMYDCPKPGAAVASPDEGDRTPPPRRDADRDRDVLDKTDRTDYTKESVSVDKETPDDVVRTKDKTVKKKEEIFVKEDVISVEDPGERSAVPSRGHYSEDGYQKEPHHSRHRDPSESDRDVDRDRSRSDSEYDRHREGYDDDRGSRYTADEEKARKAKKDEEEIRKMKLERDRLGAFLDGSPPDDDDKSRDVDIPYPQERDRQDYRDRHDFMRDRLDFRDRGDGANDERDRTVDRDKPDADSRYDTRARTPPRPRSETSDRKTAVDESSDAPTRSRSSFSAQKKKIMNGDIITVPVIQSLI